MRWRVLGLCVLCVLCGTGAQLFAQFQMPDAKDMSGIPRPVDDLPDGTVSVRLIRGQLSNNLVGQQVTLEGGGQTMAALTDESGRAEFKGVPAGTSVKTSADIDGEHLESQAFPFPARGGIRLLLVATDPSAPAQKPAVPAAAGEVTLGGQSRIVIEPDDETVRVYYLLTIMNSSSTPVNPSAPFAFEMPTGATGTTVLQGSSPQASAIGPRIIVQGPFAPGATSLEAACALPVTSGSLEITTRFPAKLDGLSVIVSKLGDTKLSSAQLGSQQEMSSQGQAYIAAEGGAVPAGNPITLVVSGLPHHSSTPRTIALVLAIGIVLAGAWAGTQSGPDAGRSRAAERQRLIARREKLFGELLRLEADARSHRVPEAKYGPRREYLVSQLEIVYGGLTDVEPPSDILPDAQRRGRSTATDGGAAANA